MQSSSTSNNHFTTLKMPSGKFILRSVTSAGDKETPAATGSNAIPICGNKKSFGKKVSTGLTLKRKPNLGSLKPLPINRAQSAHSGPSAPRPASKLSPQAKSFILPSNRAIALKRAIMTPLPCPAPTMDQFPALIPHQFLRSTEDKKMNTSLSSYSNVAQKGIKNGSKQSFRLQMLLGMRLAQRLRTGFLSCQMRKTYLPHKTFRPLEPRIWLMYHGRLLMRMMIWHWGKLDEMEGR